MLTLTSLLFAKKNIITLTNFPFHFCRDGCAAVLAIDDTRRKPNLLMYIEDSHENGLVEVSAVEKIQDIIVTASNDCPYICFWRLRKDENNSYYNHTECKLYLSYYFYYIVLNKFKNVEML